MVTLLHDPIPVNSVRKVYSGKPGCACGCRGKYTYASDQPAASIVGTPQVRNDVVVRQMVAKLVQIGYRREVDGSCAFTDPLGTRGLTPGMGRVYVVYFKEPYTSIVAAGAS